MKVLSIVANATGNTSPQMGALLNSSDMVIAADGGLKHCLAVGIKPDLVIGDGDSAEQTDDYIWHRHPTKKEKTDLELALQFASEQNANKIYVFQSFDRRWDYNLDALLSATCCPVEVEFISSGFSSVVLHSGHRLFEKAGLNIFEGQILSIYPLVGPVRMREEGLKWPLRWKEAQLPVRSQSNQLAGKRLRLELLEGVVAVLWEHSAEG